MNIQADYLKTAVLMWPKSQNLNMQVKIQGVNLAVSELKAKITAMKKKTRNADPVEQYNDLKSYTSAVIAVYFTRADFSDFSKCIDAVALAALTLKDVGIFLQMTTSRIAYKLAFSTWVEAIKSFGFETFQDSCVKYLISPSL